MREALALIRARWLTMASYRMNMVFSFAGLFVSVVPIYFVSRALQPVMGGSIQNQGGEYFAFVVIGLVCYAFVSTATGALHTTFSSDIGNGSLEAVLATPISMPALIAGMLGQAFIWTILRTSMVLVGASLLGAQIVWSKGLVALLVLSLTILAYIPLGIICAALVLAFKTTGPLPTVITAASMLLGGVYYPTTAIPSWLAVAAKGVPLTYGLHALRRTVLDGAPLSAVAGDLATLCGFIIAFFTVAMLSFAMAWTYARRAGTLAQY
jgi:ABC-2 type transport system permease protein